MSRWPGHAVVQVSVPTFEDFIKGRNAHYDPAFISEDPNFFHAHITVLAPIYDPNEQAIAQLAAATPTFEITLNQVKVFPNGIIYLRPEPDAQLRQMTKDLWHAHPNVIPNGAPDPDPHMTLDALSDEVSIESTKKLIKNLLPAKMRIEKLDLVWYEQYNCHHISSWPLTGKC